MFITRSWQILKATAQKWLHDKCPQLGAALAFYSVFSLGPLIVLAITAAGAIFGHDAAQGQVVAQIDGLIGKQGAEGIQTIIKNAAEQENDGIIATIISFGMLLFGASGVFGQLQDSLNTVWQTGPAPSHGIWGFIKNRFLSFSMVIGTGFLLLISLLLSAGLTAIGDYATDLSDVMTVVMQIVNFVVSFGVVALLFAMMFKILPDTPIEWRHVWRGAAISAGLFTLGKYLIGLYLGHSNIASTYGAAGSVIIVLVWIYYSAQILLFGAEFTFIEAQQAGALTVAAKTAPIGAVSS